LAAAYTTKDAKDEINSAACAVIDEIVNAIKHYTDPKEEAPIRYSVRRIVKLAAEAWRFARLEREMIEATMPAAEDMVEDDKEINLWISQQFDPATYSVSGIEPVFDTLDGGRKILLRLIPVIRREPVHESFRYKQEEVNDSGCIYSRGLALYNDAPPVIVRNQEMKRATIKEGPL
jgi:hypothetical protein